MEAGTKRVKEIFQSNIVLKIPYFQRSYVWNKDNWERFLYDMLDLPETNENYFLGSVILKKDGVNDFGFECFNVVDGQQRLTTLVIFSKILYLMAGKNDTFRNTFIQDDSELPVLCPNRKDADVFNTIVRMEVLSDTVCGQGRVLDAYKFFFEKMNNPQIRDRANLFIRFMNNNVYLVRIIVDENENEQQIFDTINSLGQSLTTGELLKNYLFNQDNVDLYDSKWSPIFEKGGSEDYNYWTEQLTKGRTKANNIETFFYYYMLVKMQDNRLRNELSQVEKKQYRKQEGLFESYKQLIAKHNLDKNELINEIVEYGKLYRKNFRQSVLRETLFKYPGISRVSFLLFAQGTWTPVPFLLYILDNVSDENEQVKIFDYLETYLVRRIICRSQNNNYSDLFSENLVGQGIDSFDKFKEYVNDENSRGTLLMPRDEDIKDAICRNDLSKQSTLLLYLLETKLNNSFCSDDPSENAFIGFSSEPLVPLKYNNTNWPLAEGFTVEDRNVSVKTLGNYLLVRGGKLSQAKSGLRWDAKRCILRQVITGIQTSQVVESTKWNDRKIAERNKSLAEKIVNIWHV